MARSFLGGEFAGGEFAGGEFAGGESAWWRGNWIPSIQFSIHFPGMVLT